MSFRRLSLLGGLALGLAATAAEPARTALPLDELKAGQKGEVWTVFEGTRPEPFSVEVTGVIRNALGPGKSLILCRLTDPRVQRMGAVAGMSGSPLYVDGRFAGALSYKIQVFETTPYAGFTPAADLDEVGRRVGTEKASDSDDGIPAEGTALAALPGPALQPLRPAFTLGGLSPEVSRLMGPYLSRLGLNLTSLGGGSGSDERAPAPAESLRPGAAVSVALATGDVTLAGTGTVSEIDGNRVVAFGHPMMGLGDVELPMCSAEIVAILPSQLESVKVANTGPMIGTISQDRLSAISGTLGRFPPMVQVEVEVASARGPAHTLRFQVARQQQLTPAIVAAGVSQAILGSNDAGLANGFRIESDVTFTAKQSLSARTFYAGPQAFAQGLGEFVQGLSQDLQNPYEKTFPERVKFEVQPLERNPSVTVQRFELSRAEARAGDTVRAELEWRDYQGSARRETVAIPLDPRWAGKSLEVVVAPGRVVDEMAGRTRQAAAAQFRSFDAYLEALRGTRPTDGLCVAVVEKSALFSDQGAGTPELPGSLARAAGAADEARFQQRAAFLPLWETHILAGKVANAAVRRSLQVVD